MISVFFFFWWLSDIYFITGNSEFKFHEQSKKNSLVLRLIAKGQSQDPMLLTCAKAYAVYVVKPKDCVLGSTK